MISFCRKFTQSIFLFWILALGFLLPSFAQSNYPNKPVRVILPFLGGGALDQMARIVSDNLTNRLNQSFFVDVKAGAGGVIGADFVSKAAPDGYTLLFSVQAPLTAAPYLNKQLPYDGLNAFAPISVVTEAPNVLIAWPGVSFRTVPEFLAVARSAPNKLSFASQGQGTTGHITGAMIDQVAGTQLLHIPYKGFPPMLTDLETGRVDMMFADSINAIPRIKSKELVAIAVASDRRIAAIPEVPTFAESGYPKVEVLNWQGFIAPKGTPNEIILKINKAVNKVLNDPKVRELIKSQSNEVGGGTPEEFAELIKSESNKWSEVVKKGNIHAD